MPKKTKKTVKAVKKPAKKPVKKTTKRPVAQVAPQPPVAPAPPPPPVAPPPVVKTEAEKIWEEIKNRPIEMFALPGQIVAQHCTPVQVEPTKLYLTIRSTATLPSLEAAIGIAYVVELADKFVIVSRAQRPLVPQKR